MMELCRKINFKKNSIKLISKAIPLFLCLIVFVACEKDINNTIPKGEETLVGFHQQAKKILMDNSVTKSGKIWVSNVLTYGKYFNLRTRSVQVVPMNFFIAFDFISDNTAKTYVTIQSYDMRNHVPLQTKSSNSFFLYDNINTYRVSGDLRTNLTFLNKGILSDLKRQSLLDFDYRMTSFNNKKIKIEPYFTQTSNPKITLTPYDFDSFNTYLKATQVIFGGSSQKVIVLPLWGRAAITITEKASGQVVFGPRLYPSFYLYSSNLTQDYDKDKKLFLYRIFDFSGNPDFSVSSSPYNNFIGAHDINSLVPISATDSEIKLETYGADKANDRKYIITITKRS